VSRVPTGERDGDFPRRAVAAFLNARAAWAASIVSGEPKYAIPEAALDTHSLPLSSHTAALFTDTAVADERAFTLLCNELRAVGIWGTEVVTFPLLNPPPPDPAVTMMRSLGWTTLHRSHEPVCEDGQRRGKDRNRIRVDIDRASIGDPCRRNPPGSQRAFNHGPPRKQNYPSKHNECREAAAIPSSTSRVGASYHSPSARACRRVEEGIP
jgi:hypothetical protein